jgi:predicted nucleotidyltransferase
VQLDGRDPGVAVPSLSSYPALDDALSAHAGRLRDVMGGDLIGVYTIGSMAIGDFDMTSDVDFVVVMANRPDDSTIEQVRAAHTHLMERGDRWVTRLEYSLFPMPHSSS